MSAGNEPPVDRSRVDEALGRVLEGEAEPGDVEVLVAAMRRDEHFAREVIRLFAVDDLLRQSHEPDGGAFTAAVRTRLAAEDSADTFTRTVLEQLPAADGPPVTTPSGGARPARRSAWRTPAFWAAVVAVVSIIGGVWWVARGAGRSGDENRSGQDIAWLNNAQDCEWAERGTPIGGLSPGKVLQLEKGLVEICFPAGAVVVLQGPATLELLTPSSVRLVRGRLTARVPEAARGFEVLSREGKVVDLGTEFGVSVADDGSARVFVFRGEVLAHPAGTGATNPISVREQQSARIGAEGVSLQPPGLGADGFVRQIVPPVHFDLQSRSFDFRTAVAGTLLDKAGRGTGLTHRLPGTGTLLPARDPNLMLHPAAGLLQLTTTENDLNQQYKVDQGEYVGVRLSDHGFTGTEDFAVSAVIPNTPVLGEVDQLGLYAGVGSERHIRGGLMRPGGKQGVGSSTQFFVRNNGGVDSNLHMVGLVATGVDLVLTLERVRGKYSLTIENRTSGESTTLTTRHPEFLDGERDLYVGLFGATPWRNIPRTISVKEFKVSVWVRRP